MKKHVWSSGGVVAAILVGCFLSSLVSTVAEEKTPQNGKIGAGKPHYVSKNAEAWKTKGRIVGTAKQAPEFKVTVFTSEKRHVKEIESGKEKDGVRAYEVEWLQPGSYIMVVSAVGYQSLELKNLEVKSGNDLRIDIEFTKSGE